MFRERNIKSLDDESIGTLSRPKLGEIVTAGGNATLAEALTLAFIVGEKAIPKNIIDVVSGTGAEAMSIRELTENWNDMVGSMPRAAHALTKVYLGLAFDFLSRTNAEYNLPLARLKSVDLVLASTLAVNELDL